MDLYDFCQIKGQLTVDRLHHPVYCSVELRLKTTAKCVLSVTWSTHMQSKLHESLVLISLPLPFPIFMNFQDRLLINLSQLLVLAPQKFLRRPDSNWEYPIQL